MATRLLVASSHDPAMRHAARIHIPDPFILVDTGRKHLLVSRLEFARAKREFRGTVHLLEKIEGAGLSGKAATFLKRRSIRSVLMPRHAYAGVVEGLKRHGIRVQLEDLYPERQVKLPAEVAEIRKVRNSCVRALNGVIAIIRASRIRGGMLYWEGAPLTVRLLKLEARIMLLKDECEAPELIISHGKQTALPHDPGSGHLRAGEPILLDFFPRSMRTGYWFDMTRTVCKGEPPGWLVDMWAAVRDAYQAAARIIAPGVRCSMVHKVAARALESRGYPPELFIHSVGHGVGLEIHEAPHLGPESREKIQKGQVITVEPGLYDAKRGGVRIEDTLLVTSTGCRDLTRTAKFLRI